MEELMGFEIGGREELYNSVINDGIEKRILIINNEIDDDLIENIIYYIIKWNVEDKYTPVKERKPIKLLINSIGGNIFTQQNLSDVIACSETPVVGVAMGLVASAAYYIYIGCHKRVAFKNSVLLQHDGSIGVNNSNSKAKDIMKFFEVVDDRIKTYVLSHSKMTEEFYDAHFDTEFYMHADTTGKELGVVDAIIGDDISLKEIF